MKKRVLYGTAIVLLAISVALLVWLGSFNLGDYGPSNPQQTFLFWAVSILIFILMVTLGFMLARTGVKLYVAVPLPVLDNGPPFSCSAS